MRAGRIHSTWQHIRHDVDFTILIPLVVGLGMLAYVAYAGIARQSSAEFITIISKSWFIIVLLTVPYLLARVLVWNSLLVQLGIKVSRRQLIVAFASGEITKSLPAGVYVQNYLLERMRHLSLRETIRSTTATTAMLGLESLLSVVVVLLIGLTGVPWIRIVVLAAVAAWVGILTMLWALVNYRVEHMGPRVAPWRRTLIRATEQFFAAADELLHPRTLLNVAPTALYMLLYAVELNVILSAAGVHVGFVHVMSMYAVMVLAVIMVPIPTEIGITELTGLGALMAEGVSRPTAALVVLGLRLLGTGATVVIALIAVIIAGRRLTAKPADTQEACG